MKKLIYIILSCLLVPFVAGSQYALKKATNLPRPGDSFVKVEMVYRAATESKVKNRAEVWDFSSLKPAVMEREYIVETEPGIKEKIKEVKDPYSVTYFSRSDASLVSSENKSLIHYRLAVDSLLDHGREYPGNHIYYSKPGLIVRYPVSYGYSSSSSFQGRGIHWDRLSSEVKGVITTRADAFGTLILPGRDTLTSVVRVHIHKEEYSVYSLLEPGFDLFAPMETVKALPSEKLTVVKGEKAEEPAKDIDCIITDTYQWYEEGYRYPVFETVVSYRKQAEVATPLTEASYVYYPVDQKQLAKDEANESILKMKREAALRSTPESAIASAVILYCRPNPVRDILEIELSFAPGTETVVTLYSMGGNILYKTAASGGNGTFSDRIDMSAYPKGNYVLQVVSGGEQLTEKIIKQ